ESELIGLAPLAAFLDVAAHAGSDADDPVERRFAAAASFLNLRDADPAMALELRLAARRVAAGGAAYDRVSRDPGRPGGRGPAGPPRGGGGRGRDPGRRDSARERAG